MKNLRSNIIRLAHEKPELRDHLLPLVTKTGSRDTVEDSITDTIMMPKKIVNDRKLASFLKDIEQRLDTDIAKKYELGGGIGSGSTDFDVLIYPRTNAVLFVILDFHWAVKLNTKTKMIDFSLASKRPRPIESMSWSSASLASIVKAIEEYMKDQLRDHLNRNR